MIKLADGKLGICISKGRMEKQNFHKILCCILLCSSVLWFILLAPPFAATDPFTSTFQTTHLVTKGYALTEVINSQLADTILQSATQQLGSAQQFGSGSNVFKDNTNDKLIAEDCNGRYVYMSICPPNSTNLF